MSATILAQESTSPDLPEVPAFLVVLKDQAGLWTDGRYFLQAAQELKDSGVDLMKMGMPETPSIEQYILDHVDNGGTLAFDGRCISMHAL